MFSRRRLLLLVVFVFSLLSSFFYLLGLYSSKAPKGNVVVYNHVRFGEHECVGQRTASARRVDRKKLILFYTTVFNRVPLFDTDSLKCCRPFDCKLTHDKSKLLDSDALIFHGWDMPRADKMPRERAPNQRWIYYSMETTYMTYIVPEEYNGMFNWTMTYERRSDIYQPYGYYTRKPIANGKLIAE